jgi:adenylate cyclase
MTEEGFKRKLAAILRADVEGYSRLMDDDEEATVRTLTTYRNAITDLVQQFRGRVVDAPGGYGVLAMAHLGIQKSPPSLFR